MPIEFRCSQCSQLLRVPDNSAGKAARCPKCQALMTVPAGESTLPPAVFVPPAGAPPTQPPTTGNPFGDAVGAAKTLPSQNPFGEGVGSNPFGGGASPGMNPYASPASAAYAYAPQFQFGGPRPGLPWENERRTLGCWFRTMWLIVGSPSQAFSMMRQSGGLGTPLLFNFYAVGMVFSLIAVIAVPILVMIGVFAGQNNNGRDAMLGILAGTGIAVVVAVFYAAMLAVVTPFLWAGITHLMLYLVGGARQSFETTFRAISFGYFSTLFPSMLISLVPYLGGLVAMVWIIVVVVIALQRAHEITGGKATAAVLLPVGICCGLYFATIMAFVMGPNFMR